MVLNQCEFLGFDYLHYGYVRLLARGKAGEIVQGHSILFLHLSCKSNFI